MVVDPMFEEKVSNNSLMKVELNVKQWKMFDHLVEKDEIFQESFHYDELIKNGNVNIFLRNLILNKFGLKYNFHINEVVHMKTIDTIHYEFDRLDIIEAANKSNQKNSSTTNGFT